MPLFEYKCENCNYTFDKMVMNSDAEVKCPLCQGNVEKLISTFSVGRSQSEPRPDMPKMCTGC